MDNTERAAPEVQSKPEHVAKAEDVLDRFFRQIEWVEPISELPGVDAAFDHVASVPDGDVAEGLFAMSKVLKVRHAMGITRDTYDAWSEYSMFGVGRELKATPLQRELIDALQQVERIAFKDMSGLQLIQVFDSTCRLVGIERASSDYKALRLELVEPRLARRRDATAKLRETFRRENPNVSFDDELTSDVDAPAPASTIDDDIVRLKRYGIIAGVAVLAFVVGAYSMVSNSADKLARAQQLAAQVVTPAQVDELYRQQHPYEFTSVHIDREPSDGAIEQVQQPIEQVQHLVASPASSASR